MARGPAVLRGEDNAFINILAWSTRSCRLPILKRSHRLLHIHRNVPGVMSQINTILASHGINITGQYLETNERIGYAITDIAKEYDKGVLTSLAGIGETIRLRVLF